MAISKGPTPVMKQFWDAKKAHPDSLMLFRMGDFYETFEKDAEITSEVLGITLTKRSNGAASTVPLAGFPYHSLEQHLHKLLKAGYRVAICEQVEDPKKAKGIVKRDVVEVLSPGTALSEKYLNHRENNHFASVVIDNDIIGIAILDHSTGEFRCGEWALNSLKSILKQFQVNEVIVPEDQQQTIKSHLTAQHLINTIPEWASDYSSAYNELTKHFKTRSLKGFGVENLNIAIQAAGCALFYVDKNFMGKSQHISAIKSISDQSVLGLDEFTLRNLEVFNSLSTQGMHGTLISVMDCMFTSAGSRTIRRWLNRPLAVKSKIEDRLDRVTEFLNNKKLAQEVEASLKSVSDIQRIIARIATLKANPRDIVNLGTSLSQLDIIKSEISSKQPQLFKLMKQTKPLEKLIQMIADVFIEDPPGSMQKGGYIKNGYSAELDELRSISKNANDWLVKMQISEQEKTGIPNLKVGYNRVFGFYIEVSNSHLSKIPEYFIRKQTLTNAERFFTEELKDYEQKILTAEESIIELEQSIFELICEQLLSQISDIQNNAEILTKIDIALGLAQLAKQQNYCKPEILESSELILTDSRHPVIETILPLGEDFMPNDISLNNQHNQIGIITGPNMAGKSTFLRQIGLSVIMAQIGSYVPASSAKVGLIDKLFTRVGASDNLAGGESTFLVEMNETANILNNATNRSLILLDEIGRGTSTYDGLSIAWSVVEYLHNHSELKAKTLFATHYHELVNLADDLKDAFNLNVAVKEYKDKIIFLRKIVPGGASKSYGVHVAELAGLPPSVIQRSHQLLSSLMSTNEAIPNISAANDAAEQIDLFSMQEQLLKKEISEIEINDMTPIEALQKLNELKKKIGN